MAEHGFDITDFGGNWPHFKAMADVHYVARGKRSFEWSTDSGVTIVTQNNPESGEYGPGRDQRDDQIGFASYIGIEGPDAAVAEVVRLVRQYAEEIKDESPGRRDFI